MFYSIGESNGAMLIPGGEYPSDQDKYRTGSGTPETSVYLAFTRSLPLPVLYSSTHMQERCVR